MIGIIFGLGLLVVFYGVYHLYPTKKDVKGK